MAIGINWSESEDMGPGYVEHMANLHRAHKLAIIERRKLLNETRERVRAAIEEFLEDDEDTELL